MTDLETIQKLERELGISLKTNYQTNEKKQVIALNLNGILYNNKLPVNLFKLVNLQSLELSFNGLTVIPYEIKKLINLRSLQFDGNNIEQLPDSIGCLRKLTFIDVSDNKLNSIPDSLCELKETLTTLYLAKNNLHKLPDNFFNLVKLRRLNITDNPIASFPVGFDNIAELESLDCYNTRIPLDDIFQVKKTIPTLKLYV